MVIDYSEVRLEKSSNIQPRSQTFSSHQDADTNEFLIGIAPQGPLTFISQAQGGRTSDRHLITKQFLNNLQAGHLLVADKGLNIHESAGLRCGTAFARGKK